MQRINYLNVGQEIELKWMMNQKESMIIVTLNLKFQWWDKTYVITVMHTYLLNEL